MPATEHAALGASGAHRWMSCPGSVRLSEGIEEGEPSKYALKGSAAHQLAERCLQEGYDACDAVGIEIVLQRDGEKYGIEVTSEMAEAVQVYVDHVRSIFADADETRVEVRFTLDDLDPPAPMFGTADAVAWDPDTNTLDVVDYKHGRGVVVEPEDNPQLLYYALGAVLSFRVHPKHIWVTVVQPRAEHEEGPIRAALYSWDELIEFKQELMAAAEKATQPDAPVGPVGDHCKWCPAKAICPAQRENAMEVTQMAFPVEEPDPTPPEHLTEEQLVAVLEISPMIEDWIKEVRSHAKKELMEGGEVPGYKLTEKRAYRRWDDEDEARAWMEEHGIDPDRRKTRSPYQAEQAAKDLDDVEVPEDLWDKKSSGFNLSQDDNPRPAVTPALLAAEEFNEEE